jgi:hypothetical protein
VESPRLGQLEAVRLDDQEPRGVPNWGSPTAQSRGPILSDNDTCTPTLDEALLCVVLPSYVNGAGYTRLRSRLV